MQSKKDSNQTSLQINGFIWSLDENNKWIWKADESKIFTSKGVLKPKYQEMPAFKVIPTIESIYIGNFNAIVEDSIKRIARTLFEEHGT